MLLIAFDTQQDDVAILRRPIGSVQPGQVLNRLTIERQDEIAAPQSGTGGGTVGGDGQHLDANPRHGAAGESEAFDARRNRRITGAVTSLSTEPFEDEVVRNFLADFASENLEIASYTAIIVAARDAGHDRIARVCEEILEDEEEMVAWLRANLPRAVRDTLGELDIVEDSPATR